MDSGELHPDVARALEAAFDGAAIEGLALMTGGLSGATLLTCRVAGASYVVRRSDPTRPMHERRLAREMACLVIASARGVAPRLRHADPSTGVAIMERVTAVRGGGSSSERAARVARTLRRLHDGPAFPPGVSPLGMVAHLEGELRAAGQPGLPEDLVRTLVELERETARHAATAPCHHDLNPGNVLEAEGTVYFVDWETACAGDPYLDLAELGVFGFPTPAAREELLEAYLGRAPTDEERARATLARVKALGFYAAGLFHAARARGRVTAELPAPLTLPELFALLASGRALETPEIVASSLAEAMRREATSDARALASERLARAAETSAPVS